MTMTAATTTTTGKTAAAAAYDEGQGKTRLVVGNLAIVEWYIKIDAHNDTLPFQLDIADGQLVGQGH